MADDLFHEIIDPYESAFEKGKEDGKKEALQHGYNDGFQLGKLKAFEIGIELGYMSSICRLTLQELEHNGHSNGTNGNTIQGASVSADTSIGTGAGTGAAVTISSFDRKRKRLMDLLSTASAPSCPCSSNRLTAIL